MGREREDGHVYFVGGLVGEQQTPKGVRNLN